MLDLANIQGLVVRGYRPQAAAFVWFHVTDAAAARRWLMSVVAEVADAQPWRQRPPSVFNLGITKAGLGALGVAPAAIATFPPAFSAGMAARAGQLGDSGETGPETWEFGNDPGALHLVAIVGADSVAAVDDWLARLSVASGLALSYQLRGAMLAESREHFGFVDGIASVAVAGVESPATASRSAARAIALGAYVLGQPGEYAVPDAVPQPDRLGRDGSYLVVRKLHQHVARFRAAIRDAAPTTGLPPDALAARLLGRWPSGTPLALDPDTEPAPPQPTTEFSYAEDPDGLRCPVGAHIRRANPRDGAGFKDILVRARLMQRRGLPYGPPLPPDAADDGVDRGMIFAAVVGSIERQFEFVQRDWLLASNALPGKASDETDPLLGRTPQPRGYGWRRSGKRPQRIGDLPDFVTMRGGEYCFLPSLAALRGIAGGLFT